MNHGYYLGRDTILSHIEYYFSNIIQILMYAQGIISLNVYHKYTFMMGGSDVSHIETLR